MLKSLRTKGSFLFVTAALSTGAFAQQSTQAAKIEGPVKDAGVYHVATGTWSRGTNQTANFGPLTLFNNDANTGFFGLYTGGQIWFGTGRVPSTTGHPNATSDSYTVDGWSVAYCTSNAGGSFIGGCFMYANLGSCVLPGAPDSALGIGGLPGSGTPGTASCWLVTVDLAGTSFAITGCPGDGDGVFDGSPDLDTFGAGFLFTNTASGGAGPFLNGDPNNFPYGDGTYYQNPGSTGSGLGIADQFWLIDTTGALANGCYWFGGYPGGNPFGSFWLQLFGDGDGGGDLCDKVCQSNPSSAGAGAHISASDNGDGTYTLSAEPVPNQPGIFFHAPNSIRIPFGNGFLCAGGGLVRLLPPVVGSGGVASRVTDVSGLSGTRYFQYWFRDPAGGGAFFNTSNAICCDF